MKIAFLTNHISMGGTDVALFDYAECAESLLGHASVIFTRDFRSTHGAIYGKFQARFPLVFITDKPSIDRAVKAHAIDLLYVIKSGALDPFWTTACRCAVHCVFSTTSPHGDVYAAIDGDLNRIHRTSVPVVPHMIRVAEHELDLRARLGVPRGALVIGRYGGRGTFDLPFVHRAVEQLLSSQRDVVFLFMNTDRFVEHDRAIFLPHAIDAEAKRAFINSCDVMLHARARGETFGLSCGEFAVSGKPVLTWSGSAERAHLRLLGASALRYEGFDDLMEILLSRRWAGMDTSRSGYHALRPEQVMKTFSSVFLSPSGALPAASFDPMARGPSDVVGAALAERAPEAERSAGRGLPPRARPAPLANVLCGKIGVKIMKWVFRYGHDQAFFEQNILAWALPRLERLAPETDADFLVGVYLDDGGVLALREHPGSKFLLACEKETRHPLIEGALSFVQDPQPTDDPAYVRYAPTMCCWAPPLPVGAKTRRCSVVESGKYPWRNDQIVALGGQIGRLDLFGGLSGSWLAGHHHSSAGPVGNEKYRAISDHAFYLSIERGTAADYITEKVTDAVLCNAIPICRSAPNLADYFYPESYIEARDVGSVDWSSWQAEYERRRPALARQKEFLRSRLNVFSYFDTVSDDASLLAARRPITLKSG